MNRDIIELEDGETEDAKCPALVRCKKMERDIYETDRVLLVGLPNEFSSEVAKEEILHVAKGEGWVLEECFLDLRMGKSAWKLLSLGGLIGTYSLVLKLTKSIVFRAAPTVSKGENDLVTVRHGTPRRAHRMSAPWSYPYILQPVTTSMDLSLLIDPTVGPVLRTPMDNEGVATAVLRYRSKQTEITEAVASGQFYLRA